MELHQVLASVDRVVAAGFKEIALSGVHLGSYGTDLNPTLSLFELLRALERSHPQNSSRSDLLFRISSLEPMDCTPEIVNLVADSGRFAPHFHLPLQHASNRILELMRRPYSIEGYECLVNKIRARLPAASIGSDVIVGFPDESEDDFAELCSYLESSPLTHLHVFPYSDRPGTSAVSMGRKVHGAVIRDRAARVREIGRRLTLGFRQSQLGTIHRGLTLEDGSLVVTGNYLKVRIPPGRPRNDWVTVLVTQAGETMRGEIQ